MASIRLSVSHRNQIVELALKDTRFKNDPATEKQSAERSILMPFVYDLVGGKEKYESLVVEHEKMCDGVADFYLSYYHNAYKIAKPALPQLSHWNGLTVFLSGEDISTYRNKDYINIRFPIGYFEETPVYCPSHVALSCLPKDTQDKWVKTFRTMQEESKAYTDERNKFINTLKSLLDKNNTTKRIEDNCPQLIPYMKKAIAELQKETSKADIKDVINELRG